MFLEKLILKFVVVAVFEVVMEEGSGGLGWRCVNNVVILLTVELIDGAEFGRIKTFGLEHDSWRNIDDDEMRIFEIRFQITRHAPWLLRGIRSRLKCYARERRAPDLCLSSDLLNHLGTGEVRRQRLLDIRRELDFMDLGFRRGTTTRTPHP